MKVINYFIILSVILLSCNSEARRAADEKKGNEIVQFFEQPHTLRKMANETKDESKLSGGFFLFAGSIRGTSEEKVQVTFAWNINGTNKYVNSTFDIEKVMLELNDTITSPYVKFQVTQKDIDKIKRSYDLDMYYNSMIEHYELNTINRLIYWYDICPIIVCNTKDWSVDITLPYQEKSPN